MSRRLRSEVECVQSLIMRPRKKKLYWKSRCLIVCTRFCRRSGCAYRRPPPPTSSPILYRRIVDSHTFSFWQPINLRPVSSYKPLPNPSTRIPPRLDRKVTRTTAATRTTESKKPLSGSRTWLELISSLAALLALTQPSRTNGSAPA